MEYQESRSKQLRQKAISLLYLVFIALVFIYVPSDFLDSMNQTTKSIERTTEEINKLKQAKFEMFESDNRVLSMSQVMDSADYHLISKVSDSTVNYIESVKNMLLVETGGRNKYGYPDKSKEFDITDHLMLNTNTATEIKDILVRFKNEIREFASNEQNDMLDSVLTVNDEMTTSLGSKKDWEKFYFRKAPLSVTLMILSKFQNEIRLIEYLILDKYERDALRDFFVRSGQNVVDNSANELDTSSIRLVSSQETVQIGDVIRLMPLSDIPVNDLANEGAFLVENNGSIERVGLNSDGIIEYTPRQAGDYTISAQFGDERVQKKVKVVEERNQVTTTELPILYAGIENPLKIAFADYSDDDLRITPNMGRIVNRNGKYFARLERAGILKVKVEARKDNSWVNLANKEFEVKQLPTPYAKLGNKSGGDVSSQLIRVQSRITVQSDLFQDQSFYDVKSFNMMRIPSSGFSNIVSHSSRGANLSSQMQQELQKATKGDVVVFTDIKALGKDNLTKDVPAMVFKVD